MGANSDGKLMRVLTSEGPRDVEIPNEGERSMAGSHANAVKHYLATGKVDQLACFRSVTVGGFELGTDPDVIDDREAEGDLDIDHIYPQR